MVEPRIRSERAIAGDVSGGSAVAAALHPAREDDVMETLLRLADTEVDGFDTVLCMQDLAESCVRLLDVDAAGVSIAEDGALRFVAATSEDMKAIELFQSHHVEGPCVDAFRTGRHVASADLNRTERRWPSWTRRAVELGFAAADAFPLRVRAESVGALNVYARRSRTLNGEDVRVGSALARMAAIGLLHDQAVTRQQTVQAQLQYALDNRVTIEQAKGIVAERLGVPVAAAFEELRRYARSHRLSVREVSLRIIDGELVLPAG